MRYCKYLSTESGQQIPRYALVEEREGILSATAPMAPPEEDLAQILREQTAPQTSFQPTPLAGLHLLPLHR